MLDSSQRVVNITKEGERLLKEIPPVEEEFVIRYVYEQRPGTGSSFLIDRSRKFCIDMYDLVKEGKSWKLTEIQELGISQNRNVWMRGGGWWGKNYHCRHYWEQKLMKVKK